MESGRFSVKSPVMEHKGKSVIQTLGEPSKKCAPRSMNLCYYDAILKTYTSYFSDNLTFLRECVLCRVAKLWYYSCGTAHPEGWPPPHEEL